MTDEQLAGLIAYTNARWSHRPIDLSALPIWREDLGDVAVGEAHEAIRDLARAGREFPPTSGQIFARILQGRQGPPPSFDDMQRYLSRVMSRLPYNGNDRHTPEVVEILMRLGAHELVCRHVQEEGFYAVRMMPDPSIYPLDPGQAADRRDKARRFEQHTLPAWEQDPRPGVALARARRLAQDEKALRPLDAAGALGPAQQQQGGQSDEQHGGGVAAAGTVDTDRPGTHMDVPAGGMPEGS